MVKITNKILLYSKIVLLLIAFSFTLYISLMEFDYKAMSLMNIFPLFLPFLGLLVLFVVGVAFNKGNNSLLFNLSCILSFIAIIIICLRALFDQNIIQYATKISYDYFISQEVRIKILLYLMLISNLGLIYFDKKKKINKIHS